MVLTATVIHAYASSEAEVISKSCNERVESLVVVLRDCILILTRLVGTASQATASEIAAECMNLQYYSRLYEGAVSEYNAK